MSTLALKKIGDIQTLALGYTHEASIDIAADVPTGGVLNATVGGSELAGKIGKASVVVDKTVPATSTSGTTYTGYTIIMGDDGDPDGLVVSAQLCEGQTPVAEGTILTNTGDDVYLVAAIDNLNITFTSAGEANEALANGGKVRVFIEYYPTAGELFSN